MKALVFVTTLFVSAMASAQAPVCAILSTAQHPHHGQELTVYPGQNINDLNQVKDENGRDFDNRVEKIKVFKGCTLVSYQYQDYNVDFNTGHSLGGFVLVSEANPNSHRNPQTSILDAYHADKISSLKCFCL